MNKNPPKKVERERERERERAHSFFVEKIWIEWTK